MQTVLKKESNPRKATLTVEEAKAILGVGKDSVYKFAQEQHKATVSPKGNPVVPVIRCGVSYRFAKKPFYKALNTGRIQL